MKKSIYLIFLSVSSMLCWFSCADDAKQEEEPPKVDVEALASYYWNCKKAERNGRPAASLDGLFFDFSSRDSLTSNMMGEPSSNPYEIIGDTIFQKGDLPIKYAIVNLDSAAMQLNMEMNNTKFSFFLVKGEK